MSEDLEQLRYCLRFANVGDIFKNTLLLIGDKLYEQTTKKIQGSENEHPHDSAYVEAERLSILGNVLRSDITVQPI